METKPMKNILFATKEDYLKFKEEWAKYFNTEARHLDRGMYGNKKRKLNATHFVLYAIIRGRDWKACLQGCSTETLETVTSHLKSGWFYESKITKEVFNFSDRQIECIKQAAASFPRNIAPEAITKPSTDITQYA